MLAIPSVKGIAFRIKQNTFVKVYHKFYHSIEFLVKLKRTSSGKFIPLGDSCAFGFDVVIIKQS